MKIHTKKCIHARVEGYGRTQENKGENSLNPGMYENSKMINNICLEIEIKKNLKKKKNPTTTTILHIAEVHEKVLKSIQQIGTLK